MNEAVERAHATGILTTASLMVGAPAVDEAVAVARRNPRLRVGLHLVLVEGRPVLPAAKVPHLVDGQGSFRTNMVAAGFTLFFHPAARRQLAAEIEAQFAAYAATGLALDHVTTHKHFHLHPTIAGLILRVGRRYGLRAARTPLEPAGPLAAAEPGYRPPPAWVTEPWARLVQARFRAAGVYTPDQVLGLRWSGAMTRARVEALIDNLPPGVTELYTHPATASGFPGEAPGYAYAEELAALTSPRVIEAVRRSGATLGGFSDFAALAQPAEAPTFAERAA